VDVTRGLAIIVPVICDGCGAARRAHAAETQLFGTRAGRSGVGGAAWRPAAILRISQSL